MDCKHCFESLSRTDVICRTCRNPIIVKEARDAPLKPTLNILILGETGVGKSTLINSIANYITYRTLEEANAQGTLLSFIGGSFTVTTDDYETVDIQISADDNENNTIGQSSTRFPRSFVFEQESRFLRLIDTPGIGDTRGIEYDKQNFDNTMRYPANFDDLNGICILLKPNNSKLTVMFRFCIQELLTHLHKDAIKNIVFCFTNARGTLYKPGETLPALRELLKEITTLSRSNVYCMDNEPFRFLFANRTGISYEIADRFNFANSWDKSVEETFRMLNHIASLTPHKLLNTISLNESRKLMVSLTKPLADIAQLIQTNIAVVRDKDIEIQNCNDSREELEKRLYIVAIELVKKDLPSPRTVCAAAKCVKYAPISNTNQSITVYITRCHNQCSLIGVSTDICPNKDIQRCAVMNKQLNCTHCGCRWDTHIHIKCEYEYKLIQVRNEAIDQAMKSNETQAERISNFLDKLETRIKKLEVELEQDTITDACASFAFFLKTNAIVPYNDAMMDYLDLLIEQEKGKVEAGGDGRVLHGLNRMKESYAQEKSVIERAMQSGSAANGLGPLEIKQAVAVLYSLEENGKMLKEIVQTVEGELEQVSRLNEIFYDPRSGKIQQNRL